jgi:hypothetical protein
MSGDSDGKLFVNAAALDTKEESGDPFELPDRGGPRRSGSRRLPGLSRHPVLSRVATTFVVVAMVGTGAFFANRSGGSRTGPPIDPSELAPSTLAWSVREGTDAFVTVLAVPSEGQSTALVIPGETIVDLPGGGPPMVGLAASDPGMLIAAVQATLDRPVDHYLVTDERQLSDLVDALGGVSVLTEASFNYLGVDYGPGPVPLSGGAALAYLGEGLDIGERTSRWEGVLSALLDSTKDPARWSGSIGASDEQHFVSVLLGRAQGGQVLELPVEPDEDGSLRADSKAVAALVASRFPPASRALVRVAILNGNGRPGIGAAIGALLAPAGYRVVAAQNADSFDTPETQVIASGDSFLDAAQQALTILGVGRVYVGPQPTGIVDITIVVGKDYKAA